jgi:hypothetical protein
MHTLVKRIINFVCFCSMVLQEFDDYRDADDAVYDLNGKELLGVR